VSRLRYFDNWPTPIGLAIVILLGAFIPWISALMLRRSAETLRSDIKNHISRKLIPGNLAEPRPKEYLDRLQYVFDRVEAEHQGAFASYMQHPVVQSLLVPFGGLGGWKLLEYLGM
jgi:ABC-type transport system involved in cytochrome bd biosynthesis fused ATPase/permease subunit